MTIWLLESQLCDRIQQAITAGFVPTGEQQAAYEATYQAEVDGQPRVLSIAGGIATIDITGILTDAPNLMARWYGGGNTTYREIYTAVAAAENDPRVKSLNYRISSPGGSASAEWVAAMDAIKNGKKPSTAYVGSLAASAAYGLSSQAQRIVAQNRMSRIGSLGVVATYIVWGDEVTITSTNAPNKRPDVKTDEGKAVVRAELDQIHDIFIDAVARGRGVKPSKVNADYGKGGTMLAQDALTRGMIDAVADETTNPVDPTPTTAAGGTEGGPAMDLKELKEKHPATYAAVLAEGHAQGVTAERDRVSAHLIYAEASQSMDLAIKCIKDGSGVTATIQAQYLTAQRNTTDASARTSDDEVAAAALDGKKPAGTKTEASTEDSVAALLAAQVGVDLGETA